MKEHIPECFSAYSNIVRNFLQEDKMRKLGYEFVRTEIEKGGCELLSSEYVSAKKRLNIIFTCGHTDERSYAEFLLKPKKCRKCISLDTGRAIYGSWDKTSMNRYCKDNADGYMVLDTKLKYLSYQKQLWALVKCPNKNHKEYWTWWNNFKNGYFCKQCYIEEKNIVDWTLDRVYDFYSEQDLKILDINEWKDVDTHLYCLNKDGYTVRSSITALRSYKKIGKGYSPNLFRNNKYALDNIKLFCKNERPDYEILSNKYTFIKDFYLFKYNGTGLPEDVDRRFYATLDCFYHGKTLHPFLHKTKAELFIENFLIKNNVLYKFQYVDHTCINPLSGRKLRFDFAIFNIDGTLKMIIESDGTSHDTAVEYWGGEDCLLSIQKRDSVKNEYCIDKKIHLLRINHKDNKNIESILSKELNLTPKGGLLIDSKN